MRNVGDHKVDNAISQSQLSTEYFNYDISDFVFEFTVKNIRFGQIQGMISIPNFTSDGGAAYVAYLSLPQVHANSTWLKPGAKLAKEVCGFQVLPSHDSHPMRSSKVVMGIFSRLL